ncbi:MULTISPECIES: phage holin family protein [Dietzia]|uniref:Phage holin family protein n=1 Tax=Dietzia cinnamea TaxID=321318 RepID=A0AAW5Q8V6_9ACTN|nr:MULTISPECIES: phage holin family protein [Dietzia]MBC7305849.1 phage holin family protein [Dietzia sp.]PWD96727.1 phage holin family protein [Dietzia maris]MBM7231250.1 phage holin family protein [Dietzia cinnamea]MCT1864967.1 phage holin family protein [Dietzia cinnamea]MCT2030315.1 phage holin family protein [Dietzia cinnamea]
MALVLRLIVNAVALWVATLIVPGISLYEPAADAGTAAGSADNEVSVPTIAALLIVAVVFTLINAVVKPIVQLLSLPLTILTLGLFLLVVNALMLMITGWITTTFQPFGAQYVVSGFWAAFFGAIVIGLVNWVLGMLIPSRARD